MARNDRYFLAAVVLCALLFVALTWQNTAGVMQERATAAERPGAAGQAREVDVDRVQEMIRRGHLSDHEAAFYSPVPTPER